MENGEQILSCAFGLIECQRKNSQLYLRATDKVVEVLHVPSIPLPLRSILHVMMSDALQSAHFNTVTKQISRSLVRKANNRIHLTSNCEFHCQLTDIISECLEYLQATLYMVTLATSGAVLED